MLTHMGTQNRHNRLYPEGPRLILGQPINPDALRPLPQPGHRGILKIPWKRLGAEELARNEVKRGLKKATDKGARPPP